jgi:hypothetical protein
MGLNSFSWFKFVEFVEFADVVVAGGEVGYCVFIYSIGAWM